VYQTAILLRIGRKAKGFPLSIAELKRIGQQIMYAACPTAGYLHRVEARWQR
jgi:hypothetical protein